jgi:hypothetical protein
MQSLFSAIGNNDCFGSERDSLILLGQNKSALLIFNHYLHSADGCRDELTIR